MKKLADAVIVVGVISGIVGIISRLTMQPISAVSLTAGAFLSFGVFCLLLAIALFLREK